MRPYTNASSYAPVYHGAKNNMPKTFNTGSRLRERFPSGTLPVVEEGSIESLDGDVSHYPRNKDALAGLFTSVASKSENNSPASTLSLAGQSEHKQSPLTSHMSEPLHSQIRGRRQSLVAQIRQNTALASQSPSKLDPATAEFKPMSTPTQDFLDANTPASSNIGYVLTNGVMNAPSNIARRMVSANGNANVYHVPGQDDGSRQGRYPIGGELDDFDGLLSQPLTPAQGISKLTSVTHLASLPGNGTSDSEINLSGATYHPDVVNGMHGHAGLRHQPTGGIKATFSAPDLIKNTMNEETLRILQAQLDRNDLPQRTQAQTSQVAANTDRGICPRPFDGENQYMQQQNGLQTPKHNRGSSTSFTPSSYRQSPHSSISSSRLRTPVGSLPDASRMPYRTEPRSFAPRTNGLTTAGAPPSFKLHQPGTVGCDGLSGAFVASQRDDVVSLGPQHVSRNLIATEGYQQQAHDRGIPLSRSEPFAHGEINSLTSGGTAYDGISSSLQSIEPARDLQLNEPVCNLQPLEPVSNALVLQTTTVPEYIRSQRSKELNALTAGPDQLPAAHVALHTDNFPFIEGARNAQPSSQYGVVKLKNIPFATKRSEILAFLGRNSKVLNDNQEPVHIIMERVTSKTNDAYVEFMSLQAAIGAVERYQKSLASGRVSRLGDRPVEVELSSQAALMQDLFPHTKGVRWDGAEPVILEDHPTEPWNRFKGFTTEEEMTMLIKHVEIPQRSPFSKECPQRPFECMISTLRKFPWYMTERVTIKQRNSMYNACVALLRHLQYAVREKKDETKLNSQLCRRLWTSAMLCDGFTVTMKDNVAFLADLPEDRLREFNMPRFSNLWVHTYTFVPKPGTPLDVLEWYIAIIREETNRTVAQSLPNVQAEIQREGQKTTLYWGYYFKELSLPYGEVFDNMTLAEMAAREFSAVAAILQRALP